MILDLFMRAPLQKGERRPEGEERAVPIVPVLQTVAADCELSSGGPKALGCDRTWNFETSHQFVTTFDPDPSSRLSPALCCDSYGLYSHTFKVEFEDEPLCDKEVRF